MATNKSLEEKAKAYDGAIERAKSKIKNDKDHVLYEEDIIDIFPELKESEDEKIRKELIEFVKSRGGFKQEYIAWLEKQGEQKPAWSDEDESRLDIIFERIERGLIVDKDDIDRLKSLKDRYTWKPSDEQMAALSDINATGCISYAGQGQELINLYNDLKKLKEP